jgi:nondiscriminating aspartyl-tRNA synthetase
MERILTSELAAHAGEEVVLRGWLHRQRRLSNVSFVVLRDRAGTAQLVLDEPVELLPETVLEARGRARASVQAPGGVEVQHATLHVLAEPAGRVPIELHRPVLKESLPVRLDHAQVSLRHPVVRDRFALAARVVAAFRPSLDGLGFTEIRTPKIVSAATEGGANVFRLDYFGREAFLAQSPQFYKQTLVGVFERVYETGPVFRAEPHETGRHLAQYYSLDAELGFIEDHRDVMEVVSTAVQAMLEAAGASVPHEIPVVHFADVRSGDEPDLAPEDERRICAEHGELVFVEGFPTRKRAFYTHPAPDPTWSNSFDLLYRGVEIVTGGQRLHRYEDYLTALADRGMDRGPFEGYLDAFGVRNVRETTLFPRDRTRLSP